MKWLSYRYLPLNVFLSYSALVLFCLLFSPVKYLGFNYTGVLFFLTLVVALFSFGYVVGATGKMHPSFGEQKVLLIQGRSKLLFCLLSYLGASVFFKFANLISSGHTISLASMGQNYFDAYSGYRRGEATIDLYYIFNIIDQFLSFFSLVMLFSHFQKFRTYARLAFFAVSFAYLLVNVIAVGKQIFLGEVVVFLIYSQMAHFARVEKKITYRGFFGILVVGVLLFMLFTEILRQRYVAAGIGLFNISERANPLIYWDQSSFVIRVLGDELGFAAGTFMGYFTNGLFGLSLSLSLPFEWCYMLGSSYSLGRIVEILLHSDGMILHCSYPYRVGEQYGWDLSKWHSLFAWMASDLSFGGVILVTPLFSFVYARLWMETVQERNFFSGPLFVYLSLGLVFCYANNQIMHALAGVMLLVVLCLCRLIVRRKVIAVTKVEGQTIGET